MSIHTCEWYDWVKNAGYDLWNIRVPKIEKKHLSIEETHTAKSYHVVVDSHSPATDLVSWVSNE